MRRTKLPIPQCGRGRPCSVVKRHTRSSMLFTSGKVAHPFEGGMERVGKDEYHPRISLS